jgi:hypothetical protein
MDTVITPSRTHRTQAERSERTRAQLFDATIECLLDLGYAGTSVNEICKRAGLSRGAQRDQVMDSVHRLAGDPDRVAKGIDLLWQSFSGTLSTAAMELWVAARTDPELSGALLPVDRALGRATYDLYRELAWHDVPAERMDTLFWLTLNLVRGLAMDAMIGGDQARRDHLLDEWKRITTEMLG